MDLSWLTGKGSELKKLPTVTPQQSNIINQSGQMGLQGLQGLNTSFEPIAQRAREQFGQKGIPSIAERFTNIGGLGASSAQRSSAFGQSLGQGASDLESQLAALQSQHNLGQQDFFRQLLGVGLQPQFENYNQAGQPGLLGYAAQGLGEALPGLATGGLSSLWSLLGGLGGGGQQNQQQMQQPGSAIRSQYNPAQANQFVDTSRSNNPNLMNMLRMLSGQGQ